MTWGTKGTVFRRTEGIAVIVFSSLSPLCPAVWLAVTRSERHSQELRLLLSRLQARKGDPRSQPVGGNLREKGAHMKHVSNLRLTTDRVWDSPRTVYQGLRELNYGSCLHSGSWLANAQQSSDTANTLESELTLEPQEREGQDCGVSLTGLFGCQDWVDSTSQCILKGF